MKHTYDFNNILKQYGFIHIHELFTYMRNNSNGRINLSNADLSSVDLSSVDLRGTDLSSVDLRGTDLSGVDLDFSSLHFSCLSLSAKFDNKHIIQILYHAAMPAQKNVLNLDNDIKKLFNSTIFKKIVNRFHRKDVQKFTGTL